MDRNSFRGIFVIVTTPFTDDFQLGGISLGTILVIVFFHMVKGRSGSGTGSVSRNLSHPEGGTGDAGAHKSTGEAQ